MLFLKINEASVNIKHQAFSLVEILLSLMISVFLLFCLSTIYTDFYRNKIKQDELLLLQKESQQFMHYFQHHIQHLGYQGKNRHGSNFPLFARNKKYYALEKPSCFIFFYDVNQDGCLGKRATKTARCEEKGVNQSKTLAREVFGFKVENQEIYLYEPTKLENCFAFECQKLLAGCDEKWEKWTTKAEFYVDKLAFIWRKKEEVLSVTLHLISAKDPTIRHQTESKIYLLNVKDENDDQL